MPPPCVTPPGTPCPARSRWPDEHACLRRAVKGGDRVLIIDGLWHQSAPVRHKEIMLLVAQSVAVYGASSMGAPRAAELAPYGMVGIGRIYRAFRSGLLDADDDVAVLQEPNGRPLTQALVNLRAAFERAADAGHITEPEAQALTENARRLPYGRWTRTALGRLMAERGVGDVYVRADIWGCGTPHDLKREDAETALRVLANGKFSTAEATAPAWAKERWRTSFVRYWVQPSSLPRTAVFLSCRCSSTSSSTILHFPGVGAPMCYPASSSPMANAPPPRRGC
ncbi:TfuA domain-containing protein [Streptomyces sp. NPDC050147]|uniref:TfuA domain-containing protein n=1 Tax=Streptomyces sp. NPDC050147 TaxID=3155513 RepID=UPI00342BEAC5